MRKGVVPTDRAPEGVVVRFGWQMCERKLRIKSRLGYIEAANRAKEIQRRMRGKYHKVEGASTATLGGSLTSWKKLTRMATSVCQNNVVHSKGRDTMADERENSLHIG